MPAPEIAVAYVSIVPSLQGFQQELRSQVMGPSESAGAEAGAGMGSRLKEGLKAGAAAAAIAAGAVIVKGLTDAIDQANIKNKLQAQLGATGKDAAKYGKVAGQLYAKGIVDNFEEGADTIRQVVKGGLVPPGATNKQLGEISARMSDVAKTFSTDMDMQTQAVSAMLKNKLAPDAESALDVIAFGFQKLGPNADDLLETFQEYSVQLRKLGIDSETALGLFQQGLQGGARDTDIIADAFKEFSIRAVDGSKGSAEAFEAMGLSAEAMTAQIGKGGKDATDGLQTVLDSLRAMEDPVEREAAAVGIFGTQAEDLGAALFALDPKSATDKLGDLGGTAKAVGDTIHSGPMHEIETFTRTLQQGLVEVLGKYVIPAIGEFVDGVKEVARVSVGAWNWVTEIAPWLTPFAIGLGGLTLAMNASAIATGIVTGIFSAYRAVMLVGIAITNGMAIAQGLLNAVMALNPFVLIAIAVAAFVAAIVVAWRESETFRNVVMGAWKGIQDAALWAWEKVLKPAFDGIVTALKWVGDAAVWLWSAAIKPAFDGIVLAGKILATALTVLVLAPIIGAFKLLAWVGEWLWSAALKPVFDLIAAGAVWLWNAAIKPIVDMIVQHFKNLAAVALWLWDNALKPTFDFIVDGFKTLGQWGAWLWNNVLKPSFAAIGDAAVWLWNSGVKPAFEAFKLGLKFLGDAVTFLWENGIRPAFGFIADKASWLWNNGVKPAFDALKRGVELVGDSFRIAKDYIGEQWDKLKDIARKPVSFIINTVYNQGIVRLWNKVADAFGAPKLDTLNGFARGGVLPGTSSWRNGDDQLVPMRRGEGVYVSEAMKDPYERARLFAVNKAAMAGKSLSKFRDGGFAKGGVVGAQAGFAKGGIFGWIGNALQGAGSATWEKVKQGASWIGDTLEASARAGVERIVNPMLDRIPGSSTLFGKAVRGIPNKAIDAIFGYSKAADKKIEETGLGGAGVRSALAWARTQAGKPYQWAGAGNPSWDCSGFMAGIQKKIMGQNPNGRLWSTFAFNGSQAPAGWVRGMKAPFMIGITNAGVGHTAGTLSNVNVESRGGAGVVVGSGARGYRDSLFTDWYGFEPSRKYDNGGWLQPGATAAVNKTGKPEPILTASQWSNVATLANRGASGGLQPGDRLILSTGAGADFEVYVDGRASQRIHDELTGPAGLGRKL